MKGFSRLLTASFGVVLIIAISGCSQTPERLYKRGEPQPAAPTAPAASTAPALPQFRGEYDPEMCAVIEIQKLAFEEYWSATDRDLYEKLRNYSGCP